MDYPVKKLSLHMPLPLFKELEKEKRTRIPRVTMTTLIVEAVAKKYLKSLTPVPDNFDAEKAR